MIDQIEKPKIERVEIGENNRYGKFVVNPLERGFGQTLGNSLRRVLLNSLPGVAATSVRIEGVQHEFSTVPGVKEDVAELILNIKLLSAKLYTEHPKVVTIDALGPCEVTAADIKVDDEVEIEAPVDSKEIPEDTEPIRVAQMDIAMPIENWTVSQLTNLLRMLYSKQNLINHMFGCDMLSIEESFVKAISENPPESTADLEARVQEAIKTGSIRGFRLSDEQVTLSTPFAQDVPTRWMAYADLLKGMLRIAKTATRISIKRLDDPENEKYHANSWLMRMGMRGPQYKETRRILMGHLTGFAAFRSAADMQAHKERMARKRREERQDEQSNA